MIQPAQQAIAPLDQHVHVPDVRVLLLDLLEDEAEERVGVHRDDLVDEIFDLEVLDVDLVGVLELLP